MKHKFAKVMHIINCLVSFCHHAGATDYSIHLSPEQDVTVFEIRAVIQDLEPSRLRELDKALRLKRMHEIEQDYWELGGDTDSFYELSLIGMMLDESQVTYENNVLEIKAKRN